jgi:hypothetical protein
MTGDDAEKRRQRLLRLARQVQRDRAATKANDWAASPAFQKFQAEWKQMTSSPAWQRLAEDAKVMAESPAFRREREIYELLAEAERAEEARTSTPATAQLSVDEVIREEVRRANRAHEAARGYWQSGKVVAKIVQPRVKARGIDVTREYIEDIAGEDEFKEKRRKPGQRKLSASLPKKG